MNCNSMDNIKYMKNQELLRFLLSCDANPSDLQKLEQSFGTFRELFFTDVDRVEIIEGIESKTAVFLRCMREVIERAMREKLKSKPILKSLRCVLEYCKMTMSAISREQLRVMFLNNNGMLLLDSVESYGTVNEVAIYHRNIIKKALILEATAIILMHNHPSTLIKPSCKDISSTKKLASIAEKLDIQLLDHIIIGGDNHFSMKKHKLIN